MTALLAIGAVLALIYGARLTEAAPSALKSLTKTGATAALALAGMLGGATPAITLGLALGALGDLLLSRPSTRAFLGGMAAFALGHLAYVLAFWPLIGAGLHPALALGIGLALFVSGRCWLWPHCGALRLPVIAYSAIIAVMLAFALMLRPEYPLARIGALVFVLSDILLALRLFRATDPQTRHILSIFLWPLYWTGQFLILWAFLPA